MSPILLGETTCNPGQGSSWFWKGKRAQYPWALQTKKWLQHPKMLLPAQVLIVSPLLKAEEPLQSWKAARCLQLSCCHSCLIALHKPPSSQNWGVVKSQKQVQQCSYPHCSGSHSCLLIPHPEGMWISALHRCVMDVPFLGTQCMCHCWQLGPHAQQKENRDQTKIVEGGIHKPMSFTSLIVSAPFD